MSGVSLAYVIRHNLDARFRRGYEPGDRLAAGHSGVIDFDRDDVREHDTLLEHAAELVFSRHNRDDRPDGAQFPSLSVGDVVMFDAAGVTVESFGMRVVLPEPEDLIDAVWSPDPYRDR